jgi:YggT family protein
MCLGEVLGGAEGNRTPDLLIANEALYHLSYGPKERRRYGSRARSSSGVLTAPCQRPPGAARSSSVRTETHGPDHQSRLLHLNALLDLLWWAIVISAILSWLFAFDVINRRNQFVYNVATFLDRVTDPILRPFRRIIPTIGGVDISPIVVLLLLRGLQIFILPALQEHAAGPSRLRLTWPKSWPSG